MGILNITPDSFYDGGKFRDGNSILRQVEKMLVEGATFIDVGAYSSRPGAKDVSEMEELDRILHVVEMLLQQFPEILLSIDTFRSKVAAACLEAGATIINDISAGVQDIKMMETIAHYKSPYVMMHMRGTPQTMQQQTRYENLLPDMLYYFSERVAAARALGANDIIIDPGFGFAKTLPQNFEILQHLELFQTLGCPIMVGLSRKSMVYKTLGTDANAALNGTTALNSYALTKGANLLRVHDVKEALECIKLFAHLTP